jgi:outer membrane protein OmpA-like peptidoglycan-associated protein
MNRRFALPTAGGLALVFSAILMPFMKGNVDAGLTSAAKSALMSKSVQGVQASSGWASLNLKGPAGEKTAALDAVKSMGNYGAVNTVSYTCTGTPCPATPAGGTGSGSGTSAASGSGSGSGSGANGSGSGSGGASGSAGGAAGGSGAQGSGSTGSGASGSGSGSGSGTGQNGNIEAQVKAALGSQGVTFAPNSAQLTAHAQTVLDQIAGILNKAPGSRVGIAGYTDNVGKASANLALSQARARATLSYLSAHGVAASRMSAAGYGASNPVAANATAAGRAANRRIEFTVQGG